MKKSFLFLFCMLFVPSLLGGCGKLLPDSHGELHGEFLIVMSGTNCVLKPLGDDVPEELKGADGRVRPRNAVLPEGCTFQEGDSIEADYSIPEDSSLKNTLESAAETLASSEMEHLDGEDALEWGEPLQIKEATLLSAATPESLQEVRNFQYEYGMTEEARQQYEADRIDRLLNEPPIQISADVDWIEVVFYDSDGQRNYKFTEASDAAMIQGFLCCDTWTPLLDALYENDDDSIYIYTEQDGIRHILIPRSDEEGQLCFEVSVLEEAGTVQRSYLAEGMKYGTFIDQLKLMCQ